MSDTKDVSNIPIIGHHLPADQKLPRQDLKL